MSGAALLMLGLDTRRRSAEVLGNGLGEGDFKRFQTLRKVRTSPLRARYYETTRDVIDLGNPIERFLARTGRGNGRWDGGQHTMT